VFNPIQRILHSKSPRGIKIIALSLFVVLVSAFPYMLTLWVSTGEAHIMVFSWLFALGAVIAHLGFLVGMLLLIWDGNFSRK